MFLRKKQKVESAENDRVAVRIANALLKVQTKYSTYMHQRFHGMAIQKIKIYLFVFCFLSGGISLYVIAEALVSNRKHSVALTPSAAHANPRASDSLVLLEEIYQSRKIK
jgi:hypothetical protein